jgi:ABC transporter DrrB family efflux protein
MIEVDGLTKRFGDTEALAGVSFTVGGGEVVGLLGPNGAGKTTLVRVLATLLAPDQGRASVGGMDVVDDPVSARRLLGLAGQAAAVDELLSGRENLELIGTLYGLPSEVCRRRAVETLERFGLLDAADRRVGTYSGGMRRRLDLGATLIGLPAVILLDEPTAGLDPRSRIELWDLIEEIAAGGTTILLTSQHLDEVERLADRIVVIDRGVVVADAPPAVLKKAVAAEVLEARLGRDADVADVAALLIDVGDAPPRVDAAVMRVAMTTSAGIPALMTAARRLDDAGVDVVDLAIRRPSLDDVFLTLTGDGGGNGAIVVPRTAEPAAAGAIGVPAAYRAQPWRDARAVTGRYLRRFARTPQMFIFGAAQPIFFVLGLNAAFGGLVQQVTGQRYMQFLVPGMLVMHLVLAGSVTSAGVAEDLEAGIIDRFRSLPMSRSAVLIGRTVADFSRNALGLVLTVAMGFALGFRFHGSAAGAVGGTALVLAFGYALAWLFVCIGLAVRVPQVAQLAGFLPALPLVYLSGAFIPVESMSSGLQVFARNQPVTVLVEVLRALADGTGVGTGAWKAAAWIVGIFVVSFAIAVRLYRGPR